MSDNGQRNLYQRLALIAGEVGALTKTGKTQQGAQAFSIEDVENGLRDLFARHGVVSGYRWNELPVVVKTYEKSEVYQADLTIWLVNADAPEDRREDRVIDFATSPSGAVSFALKRYYRAMFHLAEEEDETRTVGGATSRGSAGLPSTSRRAAPRPTPALKSSPPAPEGEAPGVPGTPEGREVSHHPVPSVPQEDVTLSATPMGRLQRAAEQFHRKPWSAVRALVMAQARSHFRKSLDDLTDEEIGELADEIEGLALSRNPEQKT